MSKEEKADKTLALEEAMRLIEQAQELVDDVVENTGQKNHYRAYGRYGMDQLLGNGNPHDSSLDELLEEIERM